MTVDPYGIREKVYRPRGWRGLTGEPIRQTEKAVQVPYYKWVLWLPKFRVVRTAEGLFAPIEAIDESKAHESAEFI